MIDPSMNRETVTADIQRWLDTSEPPTNLRDVLRVILAVLLDYPKVVKRADREAAGRVRVHIALAKAIGGDAASRINDAD